MMISDEKGFFMPMKGVVYKLNKVKVKHKLKGLWGSLK